MVRLQSHNLFSLLLLLHVEHQNAQTIEGIVSRFKGEGLKVQAKFYFAQRMCALNALPGVVLEAYMIMAFNRPMERQGMVG